MSVLAKSTQLIVKYRVLIQHNPRRSYLEFPSLPEFTDHYGERRQKGDTSHSLRVAPRRGDSPLLEVVGTQRHTRL